MIKQDDTTTTQAPAKLTKEEVRAKIDKNLDSLVSQIMTLPTPAFSDAIVDFNSMYGMPVNDTPTATPGFDVLQRMKNFRSILAKEADEIDDIIKVLETNPDPSTAMDKDGWLTMLTDLLGDIQVYCASEMTKYGIPVDATLHIIMQSNFSKMGADGKPIFDDEGKLQKGPNYWKPEPRLSAMLAELSLINTEMDTKDSAEARYNFAKELILSGRIETATFGAVKSTQKIRELVFERLEKLQKSHVSLIEGMGENASS